MLYSELFPLVQIIINVETKKHFYSHVRFELNHNIIKLTILFYKARNWGIFLQPPLEVLN